VPEVDVEQLDLLDQEQDRPTRGPDLVPAVVQQTLTPRPQSLELVFVEAVRYQSLEHAATPGSPMRPLVAGARAGF
jgi:hypothetical protein